MEAHRFTERKVSKQERDFGREYMTVGEGA